MPETKKGKGRQRFVPNVSQRAGGSSSRTPNPLPPQYTFTPATQSVPHLPSPPLNPVQAQPSTTAPNVRDFPPPTQLFQNSSSNPPQSNPSQGQTTPRESSQPQDQTTPGQSSSIPSLHNSEGNSNQSSHAHISNDFEANPIDDNAHIEADLQEEQRMVLEALLRVPNRHEYTTVLSPTRPQPPNTTW